MGGSSRAPIRIGFVVHVMGVAGAEMLVADMVRHLADRIEPSVFCLDAVGQLGERLRAEGVEVVDLRRSPGLDLGLAARLVREVRKRRVELLHAHQYTPFFYAALARIGLGRRVRLIMTEHGRHYPDLVSRRRRWTNRIALSRLADAATACCEFSRSALASVDGFSSREIEVLRNGIQLSKYGRAVDRGAVLAGLGLDPNNRYVVTVARFHPVKDHATLLRAFAQVAGSRPSVDLVLVGDGPLRSDLESLVAQEGIESRVHFLGIRSDVPAILGAADLFAMTSLSEAASLTVLEALASELPVLLTEVGGNPEIVTDGVEGRLVPRGDSSAAAVAMLDILDRPDQGTEMGKAGRSLVDRHYRLEQTIDSYYSLYRRVARSGSENRR